MDFHQRRAFVLPFILLLSTGILLLAVLALERSLDGVHRATTRSLHERARLTLQLNLDPLKNLLEDRLFRTLATSAALGDPAQPVALQPATGEESPLYSTADGLPFEALLFNSSLGTHSLYAEMTFREPSGTPSTIGLAWAAEDISLFGISSLPPASWPLDAWARAPFPEQEPDRADSSLAIAEETFSTTLPIPANEPLPMIESASPALVPIVRNLGLHLGVFASGASRTREKMIRVRYHIAGEIWNPYNRPMSIHPGRGFSPAFRVIFWNLPQVRLTNLTRGLSSGWLSLDAAANSASGAQGMSAWIELPGLLDPGESLRFLEPNPGSQPEGLARTLHPAFMAGPADRIRMEWRQPAGGLYAACLDLAAGAPLDRAIQGSGWFRAEAFFPDLPQHNFFRADAGPKPFYLAGGSLSYRIDNAHLALSFEQGPALTDLDLDPRRRHLSGNASVEDAAGLQRPPQDLLQLAALPNPQNPGKPARGSIREPLFSWPDSPPQSVREAMDLPGFPEGFRLGSPGARRINAALDVVSLSDPASPAGSPQTPAGTGEAVLPYSFAFPVNLRSPEAWESLLRESAFGAASSGRIRFSAYPHPLSGRESDFLEWNEAEVNAAANYLSTSAASDPSKSIAAFFSRGLLGEAFPGSTSAPRKTPLMPLRGWLRKAPPPRSHGAAWVLHLALRLEGHPSVWKSARVWLLEYRIDGDRPRFEVIRFEWTVPEHHLTRSPPESAAQVDSRLPHPESGPRPRSA